MNSWLPTLLASLLAVVGGVVGLVRDREQRRASTREQRRERPAIAAPPPPPSGPLNGYAGLLRDTLAKLEALQTRNATLEAANQALEVRCAHLAGQLAECQQRRAAHTGQPAAPTRPRRKRAVQPS